MHHFFGRIKSDRQCQQKTDLSRSVFCCAIIEENLNLKKHYIHLKQNKFSLLVLRLTALKYTAKWQILTFLRTKNRGSSSSIFYQTFLLSSVFLGQFYLKISILRNLSHKLCFLHAVLLLFIKTVHRICTCRLSYIQCMGNSQTACRAYSSLCLFCNSDTKDVLYRFLFYSPVFSAF